MKKVLSLMVLILVLAFTMAACSGEENNNANNSSSNGNNTSTNTNQSEEDASEEKSNFPEKEVSIIVPFGAGGTMDLAAHALSKDFEKITGQPLVVNNQPGGSGIPGTMKMVEAEADGYTIAVLPSGQLDLRPLLQDVKYNFPDDFTPIVGIADFQMHPVVKGDAPYNTMAEMVEYYKDNDETPRAGTPGVNTMSHLFALQVTEETGMEIRHLPFEGGKNVVQAILGGHVEMGVINVSDVYSLVEAGELKILGFPVVERFENFPDVPTLQEQGIDIVGGPTFGIWGPAGLPEDVTNQLKEIFVEAMEGETFQDFIVNNNLLQAATEADVMQSQIISNGENLKALLEQ